MKYIYDIETYINYFAVIFKNVSNKIINEFIIFKDRNDYSKLIDFLNQSNLWLIGYNNYNFDNQILNFLYKNIEILKDLKVDDLCKHIYDIAYKIVKSDNYFQYKYDLPFQSIDLMKLNYLFKSLKLVAVNLKWPKVQDLPYDWNSAIDESMVKTLHYYNLNDVEITENLFWASLKEITARKKAQDLYNLPLISESRSGMANRLMEKFYEEVSDIPKKEFKKLRTERKIIPFHYVVFDNIYFEHPLLRELLESIKAHVYYKDKQWFNRTIEFGGNKYKFGIGGIHSVDEGGIFETDDTTDIIDCDIASMYPTIIINNKLYPAHLGKEFINKYKEVRDTRLKAKRAGEMTESDSLKITLNSVYGKFRNKHSWLYDPLTALRVTINGQLYIMMLIEQLVANDFEVISANTDGILTKVPKEKREIYNRILQEWEEYTDFTLELTEYKKYIRKDVNNYIAIKKDDKIKDKGIFIPLENLSLASGWDKPIITIALREYFLNGRNVSDTIRNHKDIYDFCIAKKIDDKFLNEFHYIKDGDIKIDRLQKSIRYYISTNGGYLYKYNEKEDSYISYCSGKKSTIFNDYVQKDFKDYNIDYNYYISETKKIISNVKDPQLKLFKEEHFENNVI